MKVFWYKDLSLFDTMHPLDPSAKGGPALSVDDMFFIGNADYFNIYRYDGFDTDRSNDDPPNTIVPDVYIEGFGYPRYHFVVVSYTTQGYMLSPTLSGDDGVKACATYPDLCGFIDQLMSQKQTGYSGYEKDEGFLDATVTYDFDTGEGSNWSVVTGSAPTFQADQVVCPNASSVGGYDYDRAVLIPTSSQSGHARIHFGIRNDPKLVLGLTSSGTTFTVRLHQFNTGYTTLTQQDSIAITETDFDTPTVGFLYLHDVEPENREYAIFGNKTYDNKDNGMAEIIKINSNLTLSTEATFLSTNRDGNFGTYAALVLVDDDTYGEELHAFVYEAETGTIFIYSQARSWAEFDTISHSSPAMGGWRDTMAIMSGTTLYSYVYSGTAWVQETSISVGQSPAFKGVFAGPGNVVGVTFLNGINIYNGTTGAYIDSATNSGYGSAGHVAMADGKCYRTHHDNSPTLGKVYEVTSSALTEQTDLGFDYTGNYSMTHDPLAEVLINGIMEWAYVQEPTTIGAYTQGHHTIKPANANARLTFSSTDRIDDAAVIYADTSTDIGTYFAVSFDGGTTWKRWTGTVWETVDITCSAAETTNNFRAISLFDSDFAAAGFSAGDVLSLDIAFRWYVTSAGVDVTSYDAYIDEFSFDYVDPAATDNFYRELPGGSRPSVFSETPDPNNRVTLDIYYEGGAGEMEHWIFSHFDDLV